MDATTATDSTTKKRRPADGQATAPSEEEVRPALAAAPDEEVEEFFAILKRIHVAVKYFEKSGSAGAGGKRWRPSFEKEDFVAEFNGGGNDEVVGGDFDGGNCKDEVEEAGSEVEGAGLDLNSDPPPDFTS